MESILSKTKVRICILGTLKIESQFWRCSIIMIERLWIDNQWKRSWECSSWLLVPKCNGCRAGKHHRHICLRASLIQVLNPPWIILLKLNVWFFFSFDSRFNDGAGSFPGYPFKVKFTLEYIIDASGLTVKNHGSVFGDTDEAPFSCGWHPYFALPASASGAVS